MLPNPPGLPPTPSARRHLAGIALVLCCSAPAQAEVTLDGSLGPRGAVGSGTVNGNPTTYLIPDTLGQTRGGNLFHSFGSFNIGTGESATFTGPSGIANIIGRVTGGSPSSIDGVISSTIDGANLFLLNPSGIMFGPNASLDLRGSFHASTADYLKFSNGDVFSANPGGSSVLSVADPAAFGFLAASPAGIRADSSYLQVAEGKTISLVGGDISYQGSPTSTDPAAPNFVQSAASVLNAPGGRINLASLAGPGEVNLATLDTGSAKLGNITFSSGAKLGVLDFDANGAPLPAGSVVIRGGRMLFQDAGLDAYGDPGGSVDFKGGSLQLDNFYIFPATLGDTPHPGTGCRIELTGDLVMTHSSLIDTSTFAGGRGGDIRISAANLRLGDDTLDERSYTGPTVGWFGYLSAPTAGTGRGGDIVISTGNALLQNGFFIHTSSSGEGAAGNLTLHAAGDLSIRNQANIASDAFTSGAGGVVDLSARNLTLSASGQSGVPAVDPGFRLSLISAQAEAAASGGTLKISADNLQVLDGSAITTVLRGSGHGADIEVSARNLTVSGFVPDQGSYFLSSIDARVFGADGTGTGGNIKLDVGSLKVDNAGTVRTDLQSAPAQAQAGSITITANDISIGSRGQIKADSFQDGSAGNSGDLTVGAGSLAITGPGSAPRPAPLDFDFTRLSTTTNAGRGGTITLTLTGDLSLSAGGAIAAATVGSGTGGAINLSARNIYLSDAAKVSASSTGTGNAGDIALSAAGSLSMRGSSISTEASADADGGNIAVRAPGRIALVDSRITSSVGGGPGTLGGNISIDPQFVTLKQSQIVANAFAGTGGNIGIVADSLLADPGSTIDASSALGVSGTVDIRAAINNVSGLVTPLSGEYVSAAALLRERCIARIRGGKYSSFVLGGRDGIPVEPGNLMPGILY